MVNKLFERNLLASVIVLSATMFDPNILLNTSKEKLTTYLKLLLKNLLELNILSSKQCDIGTGEFKNFIDSEVKNMKKRNSNFLRKTTGSIVFISKLLGFQSTKIYSHFC